MPEREVIDVLRFANEWDAAHPRESHCTPGWPAVGSASCGWKTTDDIGAPATLTTLAESISFLQ